MERTAMNDMLAAGVARGAVRISASRRVEGVRAHDPDRLGCSCCQTVELINVMSVSGISHENISHYLSGLSHAGVSDAVRAQLPRQYGSRAANVRTHVLHTSSSRCSSLQLLHSPRWLLQATASSP